MCLSPPRGWLQSDRQTITSVVGGVEALEHLHIAGGVGNGAVTLENSMAVPHMYIWQLPCDPAFVVPHVHPKEQKTIVHRETCTGLLTVALFPMARE